MDKAKRHGARPTTAKNAVERRSARKETEQGEAPRTDWNEVATWYDRLLGSRGNEYHQEVILPGIERMLRYRQANLQGMRVLDIACGQGVICRYLAERGAVTTGLDLSEELLHKARSHGTNGTLPRYLCADATRLLDDGKLCVDLEAESFAAATLVLAVQNMTSLSSLWRGIYALLQPGGALLIVMMHPCFRIPQHSDWRWNSAQHRQERAAWRYLSSADIEIYAHPGRVAAGQESAKTFHFHRPLQAYFNTLGNAGLWVDHIEEWCSHKREEPGVKQEALDQARKEFPLFLAVRARKVPQP